MLLLIVHPVAIPEPLPSLDDASWNYLSMDRGHLHGPHTDLGNVESHQRSMRQRSDWNYSRAATNLVRSKVPTPLSRAVGRLHFRLLEDPGGHSSSEEAGRTKPGAGNVERRRYGCGEKEQTNRDERGQNDGPRIGELCRLLRLRDDLSDPDDSEGGTDHWDTLPTVCGVHLCQSLSESVHLRYPVRSGQALVEGRGVSSGARSARRRGIDHGIVCAEASLDSPERNESLKGSRTIRTVDYLYPPGLFVPWIVRNSPGGYEQSTVRTVQGTNSPSMVRIVQGTNSPRYEKSRYRKI